MLSDKLNLQYLFKSIDDREACFFWSILISIIVCYFQNAVKCRITTGYGNYSGEGNKVSFYKICSDLANDWYNQNQFQNLLSYETGPLAEI